MWGRSECACTGALGMQSQDAQLSMRPVCMRPWAQVAFGDILAEGETVLLARPLVTVDCAGGRGSSVCLEVRLELLSTGRFAVLHATDSLCT